LVDTFEGARRSFSVAIVRGRVKEVTFNRAEAHVDRMAKKYFGTDKYPC